MKQTIFYLFFGVFFLTLTSFGFHKFYVAVYQIEYAPEKEMLQITSRIFADDLNKALEKKYTKKHYLGTNKESPEDLVLLKKYLSENLIIKVNGQSKAMNFLSKEMEGDVLICYLSIKDISKLKSLEVHNAVLVDWDSEQQNITHFTILGTKQSFLFTASSTERMLKF
ncbi:hypothetical protein CXF59_10070 [Flavobacterium sp. ALD4]|uniref:DUF6702 family protein n=1 Tax=Flavobacterium sp. ALD4 TaxID=2058314 RepID=UPI000C33153F|nr:DUF6702 family protein [Flavobacterium sp. ALD4]PKH66306.1 hypothetical protein CXF59_10070 [Flavobacterium sp. ALD4]